MEQVSEMHGHPKGEGYGRGCRRVRAPAREWDQDHAEEDWAQDPCRCPFLVLFGVMPGTRLVVSQPIFVQI